MEKIRVFLMIFVLAASHLASNAQTKVVESGNFAVTIPEGWFSYDANISALGLNGILLRDENAERIYLLLEMEVLLSPEESMEYGIFNNQMLKEGAEWGDKESIKFLSFDACKVSFTNNFANAPRTGKAITFNDGQRCYAIVAMAIPGYDFSSDLVINSYHLTGKGTSQAYTKNTREQLVDMIDTFKDRWGMEIGEGTTMEKWILHPTKNELTIPFSILILDKEDIDEGTLLLMKIGLQDDLVEALNQMAKTFPLLQRCKDENYTFIFKYLDKNKQELCTYTIKPEDYK